MSIDTGNRQKPKLTLVTQPSEFFKDLVDKAMGRQRVKADPHIEFYLVNLLSQFMRVENLYAVDQSSGACKEEVLANILKEAVQAADYLNRQKNLRRLGDVSLYTAGFFSESLARKTVDIDYYIDMGKRAYGNLSTIIPDDDFSRLFAELSDGFQKFVDVLAEISEFVAARQQNPQNVLRMYELWLRTKSERVARQLKDAGIIPSDSVKIDDWQ